MHNSVGVCTALCHDFMEKGSLVTMARSLQSNQQPKDLAAQKLAGPKAPKEGSSSPFPLPPPPPHSRSSKLQGRPNSGPLRSDAKEEHSELRLPFLHQRKEALEERAEEMRVQSLAQLHIPNLAYMGKLEKNLKF